MWFLRCKKEDTANTLHYINTKPLDYRECFLIPLATILLWRTQRTLHWFWCPNLRSSTKKVWPEIRKKCFQEEIQFLCCRRIFVYLYCSLYGLYLMSNHREHFDINPKNKGRHLIYGQIKYVEFSDHCLHIFLWWNIHTFFNEVPNHYLWNSSKQLHAPQEAIPFKNFAKAL